MQVRSDSRLRPRASSDHHCSARWLTAREARAPEELWWNPLMRLHMSAL